MKVKQIKELSKKSLSVLLAVIMIMTSMSVAFGTVSFAATTNADEAQWAELEEALKNETVAGAAFTGSKYTYTVNDPDGKIIDAVEKWWTVFNAVREDADNNASGNTYRTAVQVNQAIKDTLSARMSGLYATYNVDNFLSGLIAGVTASDIQSGVSTGREDQNQNASVSTDLTAAKDIVLTVNLGGELLSYSSIDELPTEIATTKTFTVKHRNTNFDKGTTTKQESDGCGGYDDVTYHTWKYYYVISSATAAEGAKQSTQVLKDSKKTLDDNSAYLNATLNQMVQFVIADASAVAAAQSAVNTAKSNAVALSQAAWDQYFSADYEAKLAAMNSNITLATEIVSVGTVAYPLVDLKNAGYEGMSEDELIDLYGVLTEGLSKFDGATQAAKDFITANAYEGRAFVRSEIETFAKAVEREVQLIRLRELKAKIESTVAPYYGYNEDNVISGAVNGATLSAAKGTVSGFISSINSYPASLVEEVMPGYKADLETLAAELDRLIKVAEYDDQFSAQYAKYVSEVYGATDLNAESEALVEALKNYDSWYTELKTLIGKIEGLGAETADKIMTTLDDDMKAHMDSVYDTLHGRVLAQIDAATELYAVIEALNGRIDVLTVNNYSKYKRAFDSLDRDTYEYLKNEAKNFTMPQTTINKYNALKGDFTKYSDFIATGGFNSFAQQFIDYQNREVLGTDLVRDEEFEVTKAKLEKVVAGLDKAITSEEIGALLGSLLGAEEGEDFNLGVMLTDMVKDMLFTDSFINTVVGALYPLILGELVKVWNKELPNALGDAVSMLSKDLHQVISDTGLALYPDLYAVSLKNVNATKYADNISKLQTGGTECKVTLEYETDSEGNQKVSDVTVDETPWTKEGSAYLNEDGTLNLTWGVDAVRENGGTIAEIETAFYAAFDDAFDALKPLFNALLANKQFDKTVSGVVNIGIGGANLDLTATGNSGYANMLVPIYEALGVTFTAPSTFEGYAGTADSLIPMLQAVLGPIFTFLGKLGEAPLATLIDALPNLCYALSMLMVTPLLNNLKTNIQLGVTLTGLASALKGCVGDALDNLPNMDISIGSILDPDGDGYFDDMGLDLSGGINSLLKLLGLELPEIDQGLVAQLGEKTTIPTSRKAYIYTGLEGTGTAYHIAADKAAVGYYLLTYIFGIIEDEEAFKGLLGLLMTTEKEDGTKVPDEAKIDETIASFNEMGLFGHGTGNAIAAVVELFNQEYNDNFAEYEWYDEAIYEGTTVTNLTPAMINYLSYGSDLTREKAEYIVENLDELIGAILDMVNGDEAGTFSIAAKLDELIGGLFTNANITALAKALGGLDLNALLAGDKEEAEGEDAAVTADEGGEGEAQAAPAIDITALVKDLVGIDLGAFAAYKELAEDTDWGFTDGDAEGFVKALVDVLEPLSPVIDFLLAGKNLEAIKDESGAVITLLGYNGYDTAFVPLLEALGCDVTALAEGENALEKALLAIAAKLETITGEGADAVEGLLNILPGILYFLQSNALAAFADNLLHGIYAVLDTIRPIIDLDLNKLIGDLTKDLGVTIDLNNLDVGFVLGLVKSLTGLDLTDLGVLIADVCKVAVEDYTSASSLIGANGKRGAYTDLFDGTDLVAVIINFALDWARNEDNSNALAELIGGEDAELAAEVKKYIAGIYDLIAGIEPEYGDINWAYNFPEGFGEEDVIFASGISIAPTIESLNYPTDWDEDTAKYIGENLDALIASALKLAGVEGTLGDMLKSNINIFTGENLDKLVALITDLLGSIDETLVSSVGTLIGADIEALKAYKAEKETYTATEFAKELAEILSVIPEVINLVFFEDDFTLFNKADGTPAAVIKGAQGYAKGLAPILEALGCKNLPAADSKDVEGVLVSLAARFDEILSDPVNEIIDILPNIIFFLNANGISVSAKNMLASVTGFMAQLKESFGVDVDLIKIINDALNGLLPEDSQAVVDVNNLTLETVFTLVEEALGMDLSAAAPILVDLCVGKIEPYMSISGNYGFRMVYDDEFARYDMITILVTVALMLVENEQNAKALDELIGTDIMSGLKDVFSSAPVVYATPDWSYPLADNGTVDAMKYSITYPNNWTQESAEYIADNLTEIGDMVAGLIDSSYSTLGALVADKVKLYSGENIEAITGAVAGLLGDIDETLLKAAGLLLNVDVAGLKAYKAPAGIDTADEFAGELANVLTTYAGGLIDWLLFGKDYRFFVDETVVGDKYEEGEEIITINGGKGYEEGLALLLEALGVELAGADTLEEILTATFARLDAILANPANEVFALLPNLLYFLNANGVAIAIDNLTAAITTLINKLAVFGLELDIAELIDIPELLGIEDAELMISIDNLTVEAILELVAHLTGFDFGLLKDVLTGFGLGAVKEYPSVSHTGKTYKMYYDDEFAVYDMITVLANLVILTAKDEDNAAKIEELLGADIYALLLNLFNMGEVPVQEFDWKFTDKADTGFVFSALETSDLYKNHKYGPLYTQEMADYIASHIGEFIDNVIYLLGINIEGQQVNTLSDLINGLVNGSLYNSENIVAIRDALAGVLDGIAKLEVNGANVGKHIVAVLKSSLGVDLEAVAKVNVPEFTEDRDQFVASLCDVLEPLYPVLKWLLADEDISFFVDLDKTDAITLPGAEGYAYGIIPLLEVLGCEGILTQEEYYKAIESDGDVILTAFLDSLLDRVDVIIANPAEEILGMLPNLIYFINSNGVDTVVKNTLNAVYTLLSAIEPVAKIDLYELIGLDLSTLTFEKLFDMVLDMIAESTGYEFTAMDASAVAELTIGTLESYTSKNGKTAYKMVYQSEGAKSEMVTVVMRLIVTFIMHENNQAMLLGLLKDNLGMTEEAGKYIGGVLKVIGDCATETYLGMDKALATLYYIYYGLDIGVGETANGVKDLNAEWTKLLEEMRNSNDDGEALAGQIITDILDLDIFDDIIDPDEGIAPNGFIAFFQKIAAFFQRIIDWFKNLFN
ncbi:MAG: hypothetical protein IKB94_08005 [Clostridia bacterium]|nr:hypothetical protein [Clostridia bacterium]